MLSKDNEKTVEGRHNRHFMNNLLAECQKRVVVEKSIHLTLTSKEEDIRKATEQGSDFLKSQGLANDTIRIQAFLFHELVRTGIEYGTMNSAQDRITAAIHVNANSILTEVRQPIDARNRSRLDELDKAVQFIKGHQDPFEAYHRMKQGSNHSTPYTGLSLARITCEAGAVVDYFVEENDILNLSAIRTLDSVLDQSNLV